MRGQGGSQGMPDSVNVLWINQLTALACFLKYFSSLHYQSIHLGVMDLKLFILTSFVCVKSSLSD